uniref:Uncharacterized protein n=1 Tax=Ciona savignyi TaxID=51511 RepID=H2Z6B9_CIOSA
MYNLEHQDSMWLTQLMIASAAGFSEIVKILCHYGAKVNARTKTNQTALMLAAERGFSTTLRILITYGAYVNIITTSGDTALTKAVKNGHVEIARCLLQAGADPSLKTPQGGLESRVSMPAITMVNKHKQRIESAVDACIRSHISEIGLSLHGAPVFPLRFHNLREGALLHFSFNCDLQNIPPNQGMMLFAVHGLTGAKMSIKCRLRGPCYVNAVTVNNAVMEPVMPTKELDKYSYFMTNITWRDGMNTVRIFMSQDGLVNEKLYVIAYVVGISGG